GIEVTVHWAPAWELPPVDPVDPPVDPVDPPVDPVDPPIEPPIDPPVDPLLHAEVDGTIAFPALAFSSNSGWTEVGGGLQSLPDAGANLSDTSGYHAEYRIQPAHNGAYYLWIRGESLGGSSDSIHYGLNGIKEGSMTFLGKTWSNEQQEPVYGARVTISPGEGERVLDIWSREDGSRFFEFNLTQDANFAP
ncbi:MAG TPA: hypothetical protein VMW91_10890, partial [Desulfosporosinus sp.]|nr:hypothetical protein [Desulfosporosinus sp.]